jgi:hypothetical protein
MPIDSAQQAENQKNIKKAKNFIQGSKQAVIFSWTKTRTKMIGCRARERERKRIKEGERNKNYNDFVSAN